MSITTSIIRRTAWAANLERCKLRGKPLVVYPNTTLNERFKIEKDAKLQPTEYPDFKYWAIGDGGHRMAIGNDSRSFIEPIEHLPTHASAFNAIPFVMREENNDLTNVERKKYALRRMEEHGGKQYFCYYLKSIPDNGQPPKFELTTVVNGVENTVDYVPDTSNLYPQPTQVPPDSAETTNSSYITMSETMDIIFDENDVAELFNVARILYGDSKRAIISEVLLCSGFPRDVQAAGAGGAIFTFKESIVSQVMAFISTYQQMSFSTRGFEMQLEVGATEPMLTGDVVNQERMKAELASKDAVGVARFNSR